MVDLRRIEDNLAQVRERITTAAARSGRTADDVTLVAVSKYVDVDHCAALIEAGCTTLGESRPQALWKKAEQLTHPDLRWHLIGHLQRNKARRTIPLVDMIHSVDSIRLLEEINSIAATLLPVTALLEVNISGESEKHGFSPDELTKVVATLTEYPHVRIAGVMGMSARNSGEALARQQFARLRELRNRVQAETQIELPHLSMGMSSDFEAAIEEGATLVRVGSALFENLDE